MTTFPAPKLKWPAPGLPGQNANRGTYLTRNGSRRISLRDGRAVNLRIRLLPSPIIDGVLVRGAGDGHVPLHRPVVGVFETLSRVGLRWSVQQAPRLKLVGLQKTAGFGDEVVDVGRWIF